MTCCGPSPLLGVLFHVLNASRLFSSHRSEMTHGDFPCCLVPSRGILPLQQSQASSRLLTIGFGRFAVIRRPNRGIGIACALFLFWIICASEGSAVAGFPESISKGGNLKIWLHRREVVKKKVSSAAFHLPRGLARNSGNWHVRALVFVVVRCVWNRIFPNKEGNNHKISTNVDCFFSPFGIYKYIYFFYPGGSINENISETSSNAAGKKCRWFERWNFFSKDSLVHRHVRHL